MKRNEHLGDMELFTCPVCRQVVYARLIGDVDLVPPEYTMDDSEFAGKKEAGAEVKATGLIVDHNCSRTTARGMDPTVVVNQNFPEPQPEPEPEPGPADLIP